MNPAGTLDRIIVGAGMSGLADAWWSHARGESVALLDAAAVAGGVLGTQTTHGYRHERAATTVPSTAKALRALVASVPGAPALTPAAPAAHAQFLLTARGLRAVPRTPPALLRSGLLSVRGRVRALAELARGHPAGPSRESLHAFVRRRFGEGVVNTFLRPFTNGIYGCDPTHLGAADAFPRLVALERRRGGILRGLLARGGAGAREVLLPEGGMGALAQAIADALGPMFHADTRITRLEPGSGKAPARVTSDDGRTWSANEVSLALPAGGQAALLQDSLPHLADRLRAMDYVPMCVVAIGYDDGKGPALPAGFGFLRGPDSDARILGATCTSRIDPSAAPHGASLLTAYVGGSEDRTALDLDDDTLTALVLADLATALGGTIDPTLVHITRWPRAIPVFAPGHRGRMAAAAAELGGARIRLLGSHVTGVSLDDCCRPGAPLAGPLPTKLVRV